MQASSAPVQALDLKGLSSRPIPERVSGHASMMSPAEVTFLYNLAKEVYSGKGIIVDGGVFLGASTLCFALGLRENAASRAALGDVKPVWSYDLCRVNRGMLRQLERPKLAQATNGVKFKEGQSFAPYLRAVLADVDDLVHLHVGDVIKARMPVKEHVEIAFLDILKTEEIESHLFRHLYPRLIPGVSLVLQQDYFFDRLAYIKLRQESLAPYFDYVGAVGPTAIFRLKQAIPREAYFDEPAISLSLDEQLALLDQAAARGVDEYRRALTALSKVEVVKLARGAKAARTMLSEVKGQHANAFDAGYTNPGNLVYLNKVVSQVERRLD